MAKKRMTADTAYQIFTWLGVFALGLGVVCACVIAITGSTKEDNLKRDLAAQVRATAEANKRAKQAEARAEEAKLGLEQYKSDRELSPAQFATLVEQLKPFAGHTVLIGWYKDVAESAQFASQLTKAFTEAGWKIADPYFPGLAAGTAGVIVRTDPRNPSAPKMAAAAVARALAGFGITAIAPVETEAETDALFLFGGDRAAQVSVEVGTKY